MKKSRAVLLLVIAGALSVASCRSSTDRSEGTVLLTVSHFNELPAIISINSELNATDRVPFSIGSITLRNTAKEPGTNPTTPGLQDIELRSYEVTYRRRDSGTRVPPPIVQGIFGLVTVNQSADFLNVTYLLTSQLENQPLKDLRDFGIDRETGTQIVVMDVTMRFFGRTLSGDDIVSEPATFTLEIRP
jgi:hypothetical protein